MSWVCIDMKKERKEKCCSCGRLERQGHERVMGTRRAPIETRRPDMANLSLPTTGVGAGTCAGMTPHRTKASSMTLV